MAADAGSDSRTARTSPADVGGVRVRLPDRLVARSLTDGAHQHIRVGWRDWCAGGRDRRRFPGRAVGPSSSLGWDRSSRASNATSGSRTPPLFADAQTPSSFGDSENAVIALDNSKGQSGTYCRYRGRPLHHIDHGASRVPVVRGAGSVTVGDAAMRALRWAWSTFHAGAAGPHGCPSGERRRRGHLHRRRHDGDPENAERSSSRPARHDSAQGQAPPSMSALRTRPSPVRRPRCDGWGFEVRECRRGQRFLDNVADTPGTALRQSSSPHSVQGGILGP